MPFLLPVSLFVRNLDVGLALPPEGPVAGGEQVLICGFAIVAEAEEQDAKYSELSSEAFV